MRRTVLLSFLLKGAGYEVIEAITGEEGVEMAARDHPDLILMDIQLPGIDGYEVTRRIRESTTGRMIPHHCDNFLRDEGGSRTSLAAGCTGYIEKPINPDTIMDEDPKIPEISDMVGDIAANDGLAGSSYIIFREFFNSARVFGSPFDYEQGTPRSVNIFSTALNRSSFSPISHGIVISMGAIQADILWFITTRWCAIRYSSMTEGSIPLLPAASATV